jgi:hypothetical protein
MPEARRAGDPELIGERSQPFPTRRGERVVARLLVPPVGDRAESMHGLGRALAIARHQARELVCERAFARGAVVNAA